MHLVILAAMFGGMSVMSTIHTPGEGHIIVVSRCQNSKQGAPQCMGHWLRYVNVEAQSWRKSGAPTITPECTFDFKQYAVPFSIGKFF